MAGRIKTIHLITYLPLIVREYGWATYIRACWVSAKGGTFLEAVRPNFWSGKV